MSNVTNLKVVSSPKSDTYKGRLDSCIQGLDEAREELTEAVRSGCDIGLMICTIMKKSDGDGGTNDIYQCSSAGLSRYAPVANMQLDLAKQDLMLDFFAPGGEE